MVASFGVTDTPTQGLLNKCLGAFFSRMRTPSEWSCHMEAGPFVLGGQAELETFTEFELVDDKLTRRLNGRWHYMLSMYGDGLGNIVLTKKESRTR